MMVRRTWRLLAAVATGALLLSGCGSSDDADADATGEPAGVPQDEGSGGENAEMTIEEIVNYDGADREEWLLQGAIDAGGTITVYTGHTQYETVIGGFMEAYPDITVEVSSATDVLAQTLVEEHSAGIARADVFEDLIAGLPRTEELFVAFDSPNDDHLRPGLNQPYVKGVRGAISAPAYNPNVVAEEDVPESWLDFTDPKYEGQLVLGNSSVGHMMIGVLLKTFGMEYLEAIRPNVVMTDASTRSVADQVIAEEVVWNMIASSGHGYTAAENGDPYTWVPLEVHSARWFGASILNNAPNPWGAALYVDWLIDQEGGWEDVYVGLGNASPSAEQPALRLPYVTEEDLESMEIIDPAAPEFWQDDYDSFEEAIADWGRITRELYGG